MITTVGPTPEQIAALAARPADSPVVMVNLLKFKTPGGLESYLQYGVGWRRTSSGLVPPSATPAPHPPSSSVKVNGLGGTRFSSSNTRRRRRYTSTGRPDWSAAT
jgi:hypothetical protein